MKTKLAILIFLTILGFGCKNRKEEKRSFPNKIPKIGSDDSIFEIHGEGHRIEIDLSKVIDGEFKDFFELKKIVYLDDKSVIGSVAIIKQYKDNIIILDIANTNQLYCYSSDGKLLWEYKSKGGGPLDYQSLKDFVINPIDMTVDVLDNKGYKIVKLDINSGKPQSYFKLGVYVSELELYNEDYLIYTGILTVSDELDYNLLLYNFNNGVISKNLPLSVNRKKILRENVENMTKSTGEEIFFVESLNDTIYAIENDTLRRKYYIDFLDKRYPQVLRNNYSKRTYEEFMKRKPFVSGIDLVRSKNGVLSFIFSYKGRFYTVFYDLTLGKTYIFNRLKNGKYSPGKHEQVLIQGYVDDGFVTLLEPAMVAMVNRQMESNSELRNFIEVERQELHQIMLKTNEYSNPILLVYEFKNPTN